MNVAVLGASHKETRYSNKAMKLLKSHGHHIYPVRPKRKEIDGAHVYQTLTEIKDTIDTITVYVNAGISSQLIEDFLSLAPKRVIFNPGAENDELESALEDKGIHTVRACTLVLLHTGQFESA
mgnify:CR=1 FL=1